MTSPQRPHPLALGAALALASLAIVGALGLPTPVPADPLDAVATETGIAWQPWMADLHASLESTPGYLGILPPMLDEPQVLRIVWSGEAPATPPAVPLGWTTEAMPYTVPQRAIDPLPGYSVAAHQNLLPPLAWSHGLGPGAQLLMSFDGSAIPQYICSTNFVWKDDDGNLYLGAAGHCFLPVGTTATTNAGTDGDVNPATAGHRFWVCWEDCLFGGQSGAFLQDFIIQGAVEIPGSNLAYARQTQGGIDVGNDFGIIEIPSSLYADVIPAVPVWNGPDGSRNAPLGNLAYIHGNAAYDGEVFATKSRVGISLGVSSGSFSALLKSSGGDSGSAIVTQSLQGTEIPLVEVPKGFGILTHGVQVPAVGYGLGLMSGTTIAKAKTMATQAGLCIEPLMYNEDPTSFTPAAAC